MLEFIIAFLLSLGYNLEDKSNLPDMDSKTMDLIRSDASYESFGGDKELQILFDSGTNESSSTVTSSILSHTLLRKVSSSMWRLFKCNAASFSKGLKRSSSITWMIQDSLRSS